MPTYTMEGEYLVLTIYRSKAAATATLGKELLEKLSKAEKTGWEWLATQDTVTSRDYASAMEIPNRTALNHLKRFTDLGLLRREGSGPSTRYKIL